MGRITKDYRCLIMDLQNKKNWVGGRTSRLRAINFCL